MTDFIFNTLRTGIFDDSISIPASTFKLMLVSTGYLDVALATRQQQDFVRDVVGSSSNSPQAFEIPSTYARALLGARTVTEVDASNRTDITAGAVTFTAVSSSAGVIGAAVLFAELANSDSSGRRLAACYETGFPVIANGGDIVLTPSSGGWLQGVSTS